jgi:hypothetical protein
VTLAPRPPGSRGRWFCEASGIDQSAIDQSAIDQSGIDQSGIDQSAMAAGGARL